MIKPKTKEEIEAMKEGGKHLAHIKNQLRKAIKVGVTPAQLDQMAEKLILEAGGRPSFKMVKDYHWATCVNVNEGVVHGVPGDVPFQEGDLASVDVGMFYTKSSSAYKGLHTDTSFTVGVGEIDKEKRKFLKTGEEALKKAIAEARVGNRIAHISRAMQEVLEKEGFSPVRALTGHGIGNQLHEEPQIPCFWEGSVENSEKIPDGAALAIEVIYTRGRPDLLLSSADNWTIATQDGKIAGLFEETVVVTAQGPLVLTV